MNPTPADLERLDNELAHPQMILTDGQPPRYVPPDPMAMVAAAIQKGMDPQKILDFIERANAMKAAEKFAAAVAGFQADCPQILKERKVEFSSKGGYKFASYDDILKAVGHLLKKYEIVVTFNVAPNVTGNLLVGTCNIRVGSHSEPTTLPIPIAKGHNTNDAQNFGGTLTYLKRYLFCAALNIVVTDELEQDRDGVQFVTEEDIAALNTLIGKTGTDLKRFLKWADCDSLDQMPKAKFTQAIAMLGEKVK